MKGHCSCRMPLCPSPTQSNLLSSLALKNKQDSVRIEEEKRGWITNLIFYLDPCSFVLKSSLPGPYSPAFLILLLRDPEFIFPNRIKYPRQKMLRNAKHIDLLFRAWLYTIIACLSCRRTQTSFFKSVIFGQVKPRKVSRLVQASCGANSRREFV